MKAANIIFALILLSAVTCFAQEKALLIEGFEAAITGGAQGTVDFGAGGGSSVDVSAAKDIKNSGAQSLKVVYDAVTDGYMWVAKGFGLDAKNAGWLVKPEGIDWAKFKAISFYMYGGNSGADIAFDIKDNGRELWRFMVKDNFSGWKEIVCPFDQFFPRGDWQPESADKNALLDFPIQVFQFEPRPAAKGALYFDDVELR